MAILEKLGRQSAGMERTRERPTEITAGSRQLGRRRSRSCDCGGAEALQLGGAEAVAKHHDQGRLTDPRAHRRARRCGLLPGSRQAHRAGHATTTASSSGVTPAPYVMGLAAIDGRPVAVGGEDFTVRGGTSWSGDRKKGGQGGFIEDLARELPHSARQPDRRRGRQRHVASTGAAMRCFPACTASSARSSCWARCRWSARCSARRPAGRPGARSSRTGR